MNKQEAAFEKLSKLKVGALFMEMGTGKTKVALDLISSKINKINYILWICPFSVKNEIKLETKKWHPELDIEIVGCESIGSSGKIYLEFLEKVKNKKAFVIVDESLKIKNINSNRTVRILKIGEFAKYKLILNGTPISKNVLDIYPQMNFLSSKILNMSYTQFKNQYCEYYIRGNLKNIVKKQYNIEHLISLIKPYIYDSKLELDSKKTYLTFDYEMDDNIGYERLKREYLYSFENFDFYSFSTILQKHYCSSKSRDVILKNLLEKINDKVIIYVKFLSSIPTEAKAINGNINIKERSLILKDFKENRFKILYITYGCGSFGLNIQHCKNIIFLEHSFDYSQKIQAEARIYRIGQTENVNYFNIYCNCGLENLIRSSLLKKTNLLFEVKRAIEEKGWEEWVKTI